MVLVEKADVLTKRKLCGGMLSPRSIRLANQLFGEEIDSLYATKADVMQVLAYVEVMHLTDVSLNTLPRRILDEVPLRRFVDLGGMLIDRARWTLDVAAKSLSIANPEGKCDISYDTLIAADGAHSAVRRQLVGPLEAKGKQALLLPSIEAECPCIDRPITIKYEPKLLGYSWYIPCGESANVGCMAGKPDVDLRGCLDVFCAEIGVEYQNLRGAFIPSGREVVLSTPDCYFLGDAAGLICPPSGEGIFYAMESALQLAHSLIEGGPTYEQRMAKHAQDVRSQYVLKPVMLNQPLLTVASLATGLVGVDKEALLSFAFRNFVGFTGK